MHRQAGHGARVGERSGEGARDELGIAHLHGVEGSARQHRHEGRDPGAEPGNVGEHPATERWKLEHERPGLRPEARDRRPDERRCSGSRVEERRVVACRLSRSSLADDRIGDRSRRLHDEPKVIGHLRGVVRELCGRQGRIKCAVEAHGVEQRMAGIRGEPTPGEHLLGRRLAVAGCVDEPRPAGKRPARRAEADAGGRHMVRTVG